LEKEINRKKIKVKRLKNTFHQIKQVKINYGSHTDRIRGITNIKEAKEMCIYPQIR